MNCFLLAMYYQITLLSPNSQALDQSRLQICNRRKRVMIAGMGTSWRVRIVCSALSLDRAQLGLWWCSSSQMPWNTHWPTYVSLSHPFAFPLWPISSIYAGMKCLWIIVSPKLFSVDFKKKKISVYVFSCAFRNQENLLKSVIRGRSDTLWSKSGGTWWSIYNDNLPHIHAVIKDQTSKTHMRSGPSLVDPTSKH